jgi:hypothetical protein
MNPNPIIPMKNWIDKTEKSVLDELSSCPANGIYRMDGSFGIRTNAASDDDCRVPLDISVTAEPGETVLDAIKRLNLKYVQACSAEGLHPRFMLSVMGVTKKGKVLLNDLFFWALWHPGRLLRQKNVGRANGTYEAVELFAFDAEHNHVEVDLKVTAEPGENVFKLLYRMNRAYVAECERRGLRVDEELHVDKVHKNKRISFTK